MNINSRYVSYKNRIMNLMIASNIFLAGAYVCPPSRFTFFSRTRYLLR